MIGNLEHTLMSVVIALALLATAFGFSAFVGDDFYNILILVVFGFVCSNTAYVTISSANGRTED